jgi:hypothetical protein
VAGAVLIESDLTALETPKKEMLSIALNVYRKGVRLISTSPVVT